MGTRRDGRNGVIVLHYTTNPGVAQAHFPSSPSASFPNSTNTFLSVHGTRVPLGWQGESELPPEAERLSHVGTTSEKEKKNSIMVKFNVSYAV